MSPLAPRPLPFPWRVGPGRVREERDPCPAENWGASLQPGPPRGALVWLAGSPRGVEGAAGAQLEGAGPVRAALGLSGPQLGPWRRRRAPKAVLSGAAGMARHPPLALGVWKGGLLGRPLRQRLGCQLCSGGFPFRIYEQ